MNLLTTTFLAILTASTLAAPAVLEARVDCGSIVPACFGGSVVGTTDCRCDGQVPPCDLWQCPGDVNNVVSGGRPWSTIMLYERRLVLSEKLSPLSHLFV